MDVETLERAIPSHQIEPLRAYIAANGDVNIPLRNTGCTLLHKCVECSFIEAIDLLVDHGVALNCVDSDGMTPLAIAASNGSHSIVGMFLQCGATIESKSISGVSPLLHAVRKGCLETTKVLIDAGASIFATDGRANTSLHYAATSGHGEIIQFLVNRGALPDACNMFGNSALMILTRRNEIDEVRWLLELGVGIDRCDRSGQNPLFTSCREGFEEVTKHLVRQGANLNQLSGAEYSPLFMAIWNDYWPSAHLLFDLGAKIEAPFKDQLVLLQSLVRSGAIDYVKELLMGPLMQWKLCSRYGLKLVLEAINWKRDQVVALLLARGAPLSGLGDVNTPLEYAIVTENRNAVKILLAHGAEVGTTPKSGRPPIRASYLARATQCETISIALDLIEAGVMIDEAVYSEDEPEKLFLSGPSLHLAAANGEEAMVSALCQREIITSAGAHEITPLHLAAENGRGESVIALLRNGFPIDARSSVNLTPLHFAAMDGGSKTVTMLCNQGSTLDMLDSDGRTPFFCAVEAGDTLAAATLLGFGANAFIPGCCGSSEGLFTGITPLCCAALLGNLRMIKTLLRRGCKVNDTDKSGNTPMDYASLAGHVKAIGFLHCRGGAVTRTSLSWACERGQREAVQFLLTEKHDNKCDELKRWKEGHCNTCEPFILHPLWAAATCRDEANRVSIVELLLHNGFLLDVPELSLVLHAIANLGFTDALSILSRHGCGIDKPSFEGDTPLHAAALHNSEATAMMLELGSNINAQDLAGHTPLMLASNEGTLRNVNLLLCSGADIASRDTEGWSALHFAANIGAVENMEMILNAGCPIDIQTACGFSALHLAARAGWTACGAELTSQGANLELLDDFGNTALLLAANAGHRNVVTTLLGRGANLSWRNLNGWNALHRATLRGHEKVVARLIRYGADVNQEVHNRFAAINLASGCENPVHILEKLTRSGAIIDGLRGCSPLCDAVFFGAKEAVQFLLRVGSSINAVSPKHPVFRGISALQIACAHPQYQTAREIIDALVEHQCDVNMRTTKGLTALQMCCSKSHIARMRTMLEYGSWIDNPCVEGRTPLCSAACNGHIEVLKALIESGADENYVNGPGMDALFYAAQNGHIEMVRFLLSRNQSAPPDRIGNENKQSCVVASARNGHLDILNLLLQNCMREGFEIDDGELEHAWRAARRYGHENIVAALETVYNTTYPTDDVVAGKRCDPSHVEKMHYGVNLIETIIEPKYEPVEVVASSDLRLLCW